jgi:hypothetical protein
MWWRGVKEFMQVTTASVMPLLSVWNCSRRYLVFGVNHLSMVKNTKKIFEK